MLPHLLARHGIWGREWDIPTTSLLFPLHIMEEERIGVAGYLFFNSQLVNKHSSVATCDTVWKLGQGGQRTSRPGASFVLMVGVPSAPRQDGATGASTQHSSAVPGRPVAGGRWTYHSSVRVSCHYSYCSLCSRPHCSEKKSTAGAGSPKALPRPVPPCYYYYYHYPPPPHHPPPSLMQAGGSGGLLSCWVGLRWVAVNFYLPTGKVCAGVSPNLGRASLLYYFLCRCTHKAAFASIAGRSTRLPVAWAAHRLCGPDCRNGVTPLTAW